MDGWLGREYINLRNDPHKFCSGGLHSLCHAKCPKWLLRGGIGDEETHAAEKPTGGMQEISKPVGCSPKCASKACFAPTASGVRRKLPTRPPHLRATAPRTQDNKKTTPSESNPYGPPSALSKTP